MSSRFDTTRKGNKSLRKSMPGDMGRSDSKRNLIGGVRVSEDSLSSASTPVRDYGVSGAGQGMGRTRASAVLNSGIASQDWNLPRNVNLYGNPSNLTFSSATGPRQQRLALSSQKPNRADSASSDPSLSRSRGEELKQISPSGKENGSSSRNLKKNNFSDSDSTPPRLAGASNYTTKSSPFDTQFIPPTKFSVGNVYPVLNGRLYWASVRSKPAVEDGKDHWFTTDRILTYSPFCADFGPMNLSCIFRFCKILREKMESPILQDKRIIYFTGITAQLRTNAVFMLGCFMLSELGMSPDSAWTPFGSFSPSPFLGYRDATFVRSTFDLPVLDCLRGLKKGLSTKLIDFKTFNPDEYDYYDHPRHGDMHVMVPNKFIAFKGPRSTRHRIAAGLFTHTPKDYVEVFRHHKVSTVIRLNLREYDAEEFTKSGFKHYDLFYEDCTTPSDHIIKRFLEIASTEPGLISIHCLAGLGRTGTLIAIWLMREYGFEATEAISYLRILRPGSIIGPQQQFLVQMQQKLQHSNNPLQRSLPAVTAAESEELAREVKEGMLRRHVVRSPPKGPLIPDQSFDGSKR